MRITLEKFEKKKRENQNIERNIEAPKVKILEEGKVIIETKTTFISHDKLNLRMEDKYKTILEELPLVEKCPICGIELTSIMGCPEEECDWSNPDSPLTEYEYNEYILRKEGDYRERHILEGRILTWDIFPNVTHYVMYKAQILLDKASYEDLMKIPGALKRNQYNTLQQYAEKGKDGNVFQPIAVITDGNTFFDEEVYEFEKNFYIIIGYLNQDTV